MRFFTALLSVILFSQPTVAEEIAPPEPTPAMIEVPVVKVVRKAAITPIAVEQKTTVSVTATSYPTLMLERPGIGFLKITNPLKEDITLYGVQAPDISDTVEIHTHKNKDGVMKMVQLQELTVPANSTLNFQDTHLHLMIMGMKKELVAGDSYPMMLKFQRDEGSLLPIEVEVSVVER